MASRKRGQESGTDGARKRSREQTSTPSSLEVCVDSVASALAAEQGGAAQVELCSALSEGGLTPSIGMVACVVERLTIPVVAMIRPRAGDFLYSPDEVAVMKRDMTAISAIFDAKRSRLRDGFVVGALTPDGAVDKELTSSLVALANGRPVTFHRAIDMTRDILAAVDDVIATRCCRILSSGGCANALEGAPTLREMVDKTGGRLAIVPGGGITLGNASRILDETRATHFHCSARSQRPSLMVYQQPGVHMSAGAFPSEYATKVADPAKVQAFAAALGAV